MRFQREIEHKPLCYSDNFHKMYHFFMEGSQSFFGLSWKNRIEVKVLHINWKRTKAENLDKNWAKTLWNTGTLFTKCNVFYARHIFFILLCFLKIWDSDIFWASNPYGTATIFTTCNVFYAPCMAKTCLFLLINWKRTKGEI